MKKIFVVGQWTNYACWIKDSTIVDDVDDADIVLFTGGEDVDPEIYGRERDNHTFSNINRDLAEKEIFDNLREDQMCLGICRGLRN